LAITAVIIFVICILMFLPSEEGIRSLVEDDLHVKIATAGAWLLGIGIFVAAACYVAYLLARRDQKRHASAIGILNGPETSVKDQIAAIRILVNDKCGDIFKTRDLLKKVADDNSSTKVGRAARRAHDIVDGRIRDAQMARY
jgi:hypothetical protein